MSWWDRDRDRLFRPSECRIAKTNKGGQFPAEVNVVGEGVAHGATHRPILGAQTNSSTLSEGFKEISRNPETPRQGTKGER